MIAPRKIAEEAVALAEKATRLEWHVGKGGEIVQRGNPYTLPGVICTVSDPEHPSAKADAALIAHAGTHGDTSSESPCSEGLDRSRAARGRLKPSRWLAYQPTCLVVVEPGGIEPHAARVSSPGVGTSPRPRSHRRPRLLAQARGVAFQNPASSCSSACEPASVIDHIPRSAAGDALLDYRDPPRTPRSDRLAELERDLRAAVDRRVKMEGSR